MDTKKLMTLTFDKNVGTADRVVRMMLGAGAAAAAWGFALPMLAAVGVSIAGAMLFATGAMSKCSIYYLLGYSTCPISGQAFEGRAR
jgi:hypothetical protein